MAPRIVYTIHDEQITFRLDKPEITVGRGQENDLVVRHISVSRKHARLFLQGSRWRVADEQSKNGTRVNDLPDTSKVLEDGDTIYLHQFPLTFRDDSVAEVQASPLEADDAGDGMQTVFRSTVNFSSLASRQPDASAAEAEPGGRVHRLVSIVTRASESLLTSSSLDDSFSNVLDLVFDHLPVQRGFVMLWDEERQELVPRCTKHRPGVPESEIRFSRSIAEKVYRDRVAVLTVDAQSDLRFSEGESIAVLGIRSAMAAPLWRGDDVEGLIYVDAVQAKAFDYFDLDILSALGNHLAISIEQARLQRSETRQRLMRQRLERYHSPAVVERIASASAASGEELMADERDVTVLFADVVGFTERCERMEPRQIAELLNQYFSEMTEVVFRHQGTLDKFIGDCLMAVFGAPLATEKHALQAAEAALEMRDGLVSLNAGRSPGEQVSFRVGMNSGRVIAGDIGSVRRSDYTVLGPTVNLAARLESAVAKKGQIVVSDATLELLQDRYETRFVGEHQPKGISRKVRCYELLGRR